MRDHAARLRRALLRVRPTSAKKVKQPDTNGQEMMMRKDVWNTYTMSGYTYDVANNQRSAGGVHLHQVRKTRAGWQERIKQSNGNFASYGPVEPIEEADGEAKFATAQHY